MGKEVTKTFKGRPTEAWYQLDTEARDQLMEKATAALA